MLPTRATSWLLVKHPSPTDADARTPWSNIRSQVPSHKMRSNSRAPKACYQRSPATRSVILYGADLRSWLCVIALVDWCAWTTAGFLSNSKPSASLRYHFLSRFGATHRPSLVRATCFESCDKGLRWVGRLPEAEKNVERTTGDGLPSEKLNSKFRSTLKVREDVYRYCYQW